MVQVHKDRLACIRCICIWVDTKIKGDETIRERINKPFNTFITITLTTLKQCVSNFNSISFHVMSPTTFDKVKNRRLRIWQVVSGWRRSYTRLLQGELDGKSFGGALVSRLEDKRFRVPYWLRRRSCVRHCYAALQCTSKVLGSRSVWVSASSRTDMVWVVCLVGHSPEGVMPHRGGDCNASRKRKTRKEEESIR